MTRDEAIARLEAARSLYRGDFCEGMTASDWLIETQGSLRRRQISVLITLGDAYLEVGHPRRALESFKDAQNTTATLKIRIEGFCDPICSCMRTHRQRDITNDCCCSSSES